MGLNSQIMVDNIKRNKKRLDAQAIVDKIETVSSTDLTDVKGIGQSTAEILYTIGIKSQKDLKKSNIEDIEKVIDNPISIGWLKRWFANL